jgi:2-polyprenyl-3-methyl-5-hydroxy-6-metoxy-1,4-benzoquinol methylase
MNSDKNFKAMSKVFWNERYAAHSTVYGEAPNEFFKTQLDNLLPGKILLPAEGEGRNALYAASKGWQVTAFDYSEQAQQKALTQAKALAVTIDYTVQDIQMITLPIQHYDVVALIYVHLQAALREKFFEQVVRSLKPGGTIILEGFSANQLKFNSGGPKEVGMLYTPTLVTQLFQSLRLEFLMEEEIILDEGEFHKGPASVVRVVAKKT